MHTIAEVVFLQYLQTKRRAGGFNLAEIETVGIKVMELMELGHTDSVIVLGIQKRFPNADTSSIETFVSNAREMFSLSRTRKGDKRPVNPQQLKRFEVYYRNISKLDLVGYYANGYVYLLGTELAVLRLFSKLYQTLEDASVGRHDGNWYFRFKN